MATNQAAGFLPPSLQKPFGQLWWFKKTWLKNYVILPIKRWGGGIVPSP